MIQISGKTFAICVTVAATLVGGGTGIGSLALMDYRIEKLEESTTAMQAAIERLQSADIIRQSEMNLLQVNLLNSIHAVDKKVERIVGMLEADSKRATFHTRPRPGEALTGASNGIP